MLPLLILALVTLQRLVELAWSRANAARMRDSGGVEVGQGHYWPLIGVHAAWLAGLWLTAVVLVLSGHSLPVEPILLALYLALQVARIWVLATLGRRWTTRVIVLPGAPLVRTGPYCWVNHPNYLVLVAEVAVLPLIFGLWGYAVAFSILNAATLVVRLRVETAALRRLG